MKKIKLFLNGFKKGLKKFSNLITTIINSVLLSIVYIMGVGFTSIFAKLCRKHFLDTKLSDKETYWSDLGLKKKSIEKYYRQF